MQPNQPHFSPEAAQGILALDFSQEDKDRMRELAAKARQGTLVPEEQEEIDSYGRVGSLLSIMKSKARQALKNKAQGNGSAG